MNRSELHTRLGLAVGVTFPRVLGIEATGTVAACPGGEFPVGQQVATLMGGMGRTFDGGYAEYTCVPAGQVVPFTSSSGLGHVGRGTRDAADGSRFAHDRSGRPTRTVHPHSRRHLLGGHGHRRVGQTARHDCAVHHPEPGQDRSPRPRSAPITSLIDDGRIAEQVRDILPDGVDAALELVGTPTLPDTLAATRVHGVVCFTGMLSNQWTVPDFYPIDYIPRGVRLTAYSGGARDLPAKVLQDFLDAVATRRRRRPAPPRLPPR